MLNTGMEIAPQPTLRIEELSQTEFRERFTAYLQTFNHLGLTEPRTETYLTLTDGNAPLGIALIDCHGTNEYLSFLEVRGDKSGHGYSKLLLKAAFEFSSRHSGALLISPYTDEGLRLDPEITRLNGRVPGVTAYHAQTC